MTDPCSVSIVLSTFNRAEQLPAAIEHLLAQADAPPYELLVVDNNSSDGTRNVLEACAARAAGRIRTLFEPRQGLSHARNAGLAAARADIVAFTDDDVRVGPEWVAAILRAFSTHPDVDCVGGRTLPLWPAEPPRWLTRNHWVGPLALQDYGDVPFIVDARRPLSLAGANLAFRKSVFAKIGLFSAEFLRSEDTELLMRFWRWGGRALYDPAMLIHAAVQPARLTKAYHRQWFATIGRSNARMRLEELSDPVLGLRESVPQIPRVLGVPRFAFRQLGSEAWSWLAANAAGHRDEAFSHELRMWLLRGYISESRAIARNRP